MPMKDPLLKLLKKQKRIDESNNGTYGQCAGSILLNVLNSPEYLAICPKVNSIYS